MNLTGVSRRRFPPNVQRVRAVQNATVRQMSIFSRIVTVWYCKQARLADPDLAIGVGRWAFSPSKTHDSVGQVVFTRLSLSLQVWQARVLPAASQMCLVDSVEVTKSCWGAVYRRRASVSSRRS